MLDAGLSKKYNYLSTNTNKQLTYSKDWIVNHKISIFYFPISPTSN